MFIELFGREITGYGLFTAVGFTMVIIYLRFQRYYKEIDFDASIIAFVSALVGGGIGAKVLYWFTEPKVFLILFNPNIEFLKRLEYLFASGFVFIGGLIGAGIGIYVFLKIYKKMNALLVLDLFAISLTILHIFGRMGCFMAGCCYGKETTSWLGITFTEGGIAPYGVKLFPTQLFSVGGNILIFIILISLSQKNKIPGKLIGLYLTMYSTGRFLLEFFRGDQFRGFFLGFSTSQWLSIPLFILGLMTLYISARINLKNE
ncbi:MAG: prolipoprotein diacylglyceryl transferase [Tissierellia bacterium]|nr:prolipoprotein diacylglyceryl transferase [Tissierellia bacterium]